MDELEKNIQEIRESQIRMEDDIRYHIRRTDLLEKKVEPLVVAYTGIKWLIPAVVIIIGVVARLKGFI